MPSFLNRFVSQTLAPILLSLLAVPLLLSCDHATDGPPYQEGVASWYGEKFHGRKTASGERYDMNEMTAAHKKLPFGTKVVVRNLASGETAQVRINDRGPFKEGRVIDLSRAAAQELGIVDEGKAKVELYIEGEVPGS